MRCAVVFCLLCAAARAHWYSDPDQALRQARAQGKPLLVYGWDGSAISPVLHRKPFRHARLRRVADRFIMLKVKARGANALRFGLPRGQAGVRVFSPEGELLGSYRAHNLPLDRIVGIMKQFAVGIDQRRVELDRYVLSFGRATPEQAGRVARLAKQLGDDDPLVRAHASRRLTALGEPAYLHLTKHVPLDPEVAQRRRSVLERLARPRRTILRAGLQRDVAWLADRAPARLKSILPNRAFQGEPLEWWNDFGRRFRWDPQNDRYVEWEPWRGGGLRLRNREFVQVRQSQGALDLNKPFTIELWARWWDGGAARMVPLCGDEVWRGMHATINAPGAAGFVLRRHRWKLDQFILDFTAGTTSNSWYQVWGRPIPRDTGWFHVAVVREPHRVRLYYNGEEIGRAAAQGVTFRASPTDLFLGTRLHAWMDRANAHDLRAFHVAQRALYDGPFLPPQHLTPNKQTEILLDFAHTQDRRLPDRSGNLRHGIFDGPGIFDSIRGPNYATFEAEQGTWSRAWTRSERDLSSDGSEITIWSTFDTGQEGHWATLPLRVKKAGRYRILFAGSDLRQLSNRPSISPFHWRIGDQRAWTPAHAEVVLPGRHNLALIGVRQLAAGEHMFGLKLQKKRQRPDQRWALRFDALVLQRIEGER